MNFSDLLEEVSLPGPPRLVVVEPEGLGVDTIRAEVGIVPGSFDPPTTAHLALAEALQQSGCARVFLLYSIRTLPKEDAPEAHPPLLTDEERLQALVALASPREWLGAVVSSHGLISEQAEAASGMFPNARVVFGVGSDKVIQVFDPAWYGDRNEALRTLFSRAEIRYAARAGEREEARSTILSNSAYAAKVSELELPPNLAYVSSRELRRVIARGRLPRALLPAEVLQVVEEAVRRASTRAPGRRSPSEGSEKTP